jgi:Domain of unknown function (DUF4910)/winged helix-turn-helix
VGDAGELTYKRSRWGDAEIDRAVQLVLRDRATGFSVEDFSPYGYDERQFCSPGFDLPVGCLMRSPHNSYPQYHTSAESPAFVSAAALADTLDALEAIVDAVEGNHRYVNLSPKGAPQLGRRGLYPSMGGPTAQAEQLAMLWMLNLSDGGHSVLDTPTDQGPLRSAADGFHPPRGRRPAARPRPASWTGRVTPAVPRRADPAPSRVRARRARCRRCRARSDVNSLWPVPRSGTAGGVNRPTRGTMRLAHGSRLH